MSFLYRVTEVYFRLVLPVCLLTTGSIGVFIYLRSGQTGLALAWGALVAFALAVLWATNTRKAKMRWRQLENEDRPPRQRRR